MNSNDTLTALKVAVAEGRTVYFRTYTRATKINARVVARFAKVGAQPWKVVGGSIYLARGKSWDCADGCQITIQ